MRKKISQDVVRSILTLELEGVPPLKIVASFPDINRGTIKKIRYGGTSSSRFMYMKIMQERLLAKIESAWIQQRELFPKTELEIPFPWAYIMDDVLEIIEIFLLRMANVDVDLLYDNKSSYDYDFILKIFEDCRGKKLNFSHISKKFGLTRRTLSKWFKFESDLINETYIQGMREAAYTLQFDFYLSGKDFNEIAPNIYEFISRLLAFDNFATLE